MNHNEIDTGLLRSYMDGEIDTTKAVAVSEHLEACGSCQAEFKALKTNAAGMREGLDELPQTATDPKSAWNALQSRLSPTEASRASFGTALRKWSPAGVGALATVVALLFALAPVRSWAQSFLSIFRVERFAVLELNPDTMEYGGMEDGAAFNQAVTRLLSSEVTITEPMRNAVPVADAATASKLTQFPVRLLDEGKPGTFLFRSSFSAQMNLDRDRIQSILEEAGRNDVQIPESVDGARVAFHVPAGIVGFYGNCGNRPERMQGRDEKPRDDGDATCITLLEFRSPTFTAPDRVDPAQVAQAALEFMGMSADDAASFTQTVDWTSTLVLPVMRGQMSYEQIAVNGNDGVLLRPRGQEKNGHFSLLWVTDGVVDNLNAYGDDTTALNLAAQLE
jgi:hypothetical protein